MMKIVIVVGARPNFMKAAPVLRAVRAHNARMAAGNPGRADQVQAILVHTGQHYDELMSGSFFTQLGLPAPDAHLGVGSGSHAAQTGEIMKKFEAVLVAERPDAVVVVGDVNSTLACALVAAKIAFDAAGSRPLVAHVEAGLRSFDRSMPEEVNRVLTDHLSDLLFVSEASGVRNLSHEGIPAERIHFVGNTMIDSLLAFESQADGSSILETLGLEKAAYALMTLHRPANVDHADTFRGIVAGVDELARRYPVIFPVHPRTRAHLSELGLTFHSSGDSHGIVLTEPLGYLDFVCLMKNAAVVITDSGGIQEETTCLGIPCVTVRENTERPVTVESGTNVLAGVAADDIRRAIGQQMGRRPAGRCTPPKWDGQAATRIVDVLLASCHEWLSSRTVLSSTVCA
jgi:UDP-N-acetylglucosamine 2-epimerase (non-hydrolysing)